MLKSAVIGIAIGLVMFGAGAALVGSGAFSRSAPQTTADLVPVGDAGGDSAVLFCSTTSAASISGRVVLPPYEPTGGRYQAGQAPCGGARVVIAKVGGAVTTVYANSAGYYGATGLDAGDYRIQAFWQGRSSNNGNLATVAGHSYTRQITVN